MKILFATIVLLATASRAFAQTSCATADDLCTGNPCVIGTLEVETPCEVDFGSRALVIAGTLTVPDGGTLMLTAADVQVVGAIDGHHAGSGAVVSLIADTGAAMIGGPIDVSGTAASGGAYVAGQTGVTLDASIRARGKLGPGGSVTLWSAAGDVLVRKAIDVRGTSGGSIRIEGPVPTMGPGHNVGVDKTLDARGSAGSGGLVSVTGPFVSFFKTVDVRGKGGDGGTVHLFASQRLEVNTGAKLFATGSTNGGTIELLMPPAGDATIVIWGKLVARGLAQDGGSLSASGPSGFVGLEGEVDVRGVVAGGQVTIDADRLTLAKARVRVAGGSGSGEVRVSQTGTDDVTIDAKIDARVSGTIAVSADAANMTVTGAFFAGPSGCVGLSAGGILDTTGVRSDVPIVASCP